MTLAQMRARMAAAIERMKAIHAEAGDNAFTDEQDTEFTKLDEERADLAKRIEREEKRSSLIESLRSVEPVTEPGDAGTEIRSESGEARGPAVHVKSDPFEVLRSHRSMPERKATQALIDSVLRSNEGKFDTVENQADVERQFEKTLRRHGRDHEWSANILARSRDEYTTAFEKYMIGEAFSWDNEERAAMVVGTNTAGGYLVPTHLDPTLVLINNGVSNIMRQYATVKTLTGGEQSWNGVSTAGATAAWGSELLEVPDITPGVNTSGIPIKKAHGLVQASIEATQDISGLVSDLMMVLADARDRHEAVAHMTGTGATGVNGQPFGLFTRLDATPAVERSTITAGVISSADLRGMVTAVPVRYRSRAAWLMNPLFNLAIKDLGTAVSSTYSGPIQEWGPDRIYTKPVVESDEAPGNFTSTTQIENITVLGDLSQYFIIDKPGSVSIEYIPHLFNTANNLPDGRRAWYMYWRTGADVWNTAAFRLLQDKTSA